MAQNSSPYKNPLNVGLVARICRVSKKTILNWIYKYNKGGDGLKAFRTYGGHYRIWPGDLHEFLHRHKINVPFHYVDTRQLSALIFGYGVFDAAAIQQIIIQQNTCQITHLSNLAEALLFIGQKAPDLVFVDYDADSVTHSEITTLMRHMAKNPFKLVLTTSSMDGITSLASIPKDLNNGHVMTGTFGNVIQQLPFFLKK